MSRQPWRAAACKWFLCEAEQASEEKKESQGILSCRDEAR